MSGRFDNPGHRESHRQDHGPDRPIWMPGRALFGWLRTKKHRGLARLALIATLGALVIAVGPEIVQRCFPYPVEDLRAGLPDSLRIRDRHGALLREAVNDRGQRARWTPLEALSPWVVEATVAVEDQRFEHHAGVDAIGVARAAYQNLRALRLVSGASTLTMQLARLVHPERRARRRSPWGKLWEAYDALRIERAVSKTTILEQYLNRAPYGAGTIGVEAASHRYFGKPSLHLSLAEAALLAGLPKGPSVLNPLRFPEAARARQRTVLRRLRATGRISEPAHVQALSEPLNLTRTVPPPLAMHFTEMVVRQARQRVRQKINSADCAAIRPGFKAPDGEHTLAVCDLEGNAEAGTKGKQDVLFVFGRTPRGEAGDLVTTLDGDLQRDLEALTREHVASLADRGLSNAAVVVVDNQTCAIRALIGSTDFWDADQGSVNGALALRQPGSTLKPFTYALAFERGDSPATVVPDVETHYRNRDDAQFTPQNFGRTFSGPVRMAEALGRSLNVPAIRTARRVGVEGLLARLRQIGFDSLDQTADHYGLGLTLGNGEVTLLELATGYAMFARGGRTCRAQLRPSLDAADSEGTPRAFSRGVAHLVTHILSDEQLRIAAFGAQNSLLLGFPVAVKTGTSKNFRDSWAIGYTPGFTVAVWTGDFAGRPMQRLAGSTGAGPLFHRVMHRVADRSEERLGFQLEAQAPELDMVSTEICALSGRRATPICPHRRQIQALAPDPDAVGPMAGRPTWTLECDWHRTLRTDQRNGLLAGPKCPDRHTEARRFVVLPGVYTAWQAEQRPHEAPPTRYSPLCPAQGVVPQAVVITQPRAHDVYLIEPGYDRATQSLHLRAEIDPAPPSVIWLLDGQPIAQALWPYDLQWTLAKGAHRLQAVAGSRRSDPVLFEVR